MKLIIRDKVINGDIKIILNRLKHDCSKPWLFREMKESNKNIISNCPYHGKGIEKKPSWSIYNAHDNSKIEFGLSYCFTCNRTTPLPQLVADCFEEDLEFGQQWLYDNFGGDRYEENLLPEIDLNEKPKLKFLDESILEKYDYYHPYMWERKLTKEVVDRFRIGYDKSRNAITFPVYDIKNRLKFVTARAVDQKKFWIPPEAEKESNLYLLNYAIQDNAQVILICEGQLDSLCGYEYGIPSVATLGGITPEQIKLLNKSGARIIITAFDNDEAGKRFTEKVNKGIRDDVLVYKFEFPPGKKDINDLSKEEFQTEIKRLGINI